MSLCEFLLTNHKDMLTIHQTKELKILEVTARIFQVLVQQESILPFDAYKRHHSQPDLIVEQLLMNSHIDLCSRTLKILRESLNDADFFSQINDMVVKYARKALELKGLCRQNNTTGPNSFSRSTQDFDSGNKRFSLAMPLSTQKSTASKFRKQSHPIDQIPINISTLSPNINIVASSSPSSSISSSFKNFYKFGASSNTTNQIFNSNL